LTGLAAATEHSASTAAQTQHREQQDKPQRMRLEQMVGL
jgi:hypothetical protein